MKLLVGVGIALLLGGCSAANISSQVRESGNTGSNMMTRCVDFATGDSADVNETLKQFDGWKMIYTSEYTTSNKSSSAAVMCFERPYS